MVCSEHRDIDWAFRSLGGESEPVIMIAVCDRRDGWVEPSSDPIDYERAVVGAADVHRERNGALLRLHVAVCSKTLDTADIVREGIFHQLRASFRTPTTHPECVQLRQSRRSNGSFAVAAIPAARSFAIRLMSFTGTGLLSGKCTVPLRSS